MGLTFAKGRYGASSEDVAAGVASDVSEHERVAPEESAGFGRDAWGDQAVIDPSHTPVADAVIAVVSWIVGLFTSWLRKKIPFLSK